jgi:hypothetical protein
MDAGEFTCPSLQIFLPAKTGDTDNAITTKPTIKIRNVCFILIPFSCCCCLGSGTYRHSFLRLLQMTSPLTFAKTMPWVQKKSFAHNHIKYQRVKKNNLLVPQKPAPGYVVYGQSVTFRAIPHHCVNTPGRIPGTKKHFIQEEYLEYDIKTRSYNQSPVHFFSGWYNL